MRSSPGSAGHGCTPDAGRSNTICSGSFRVVRRPMLAAGEVGRTAGGESEPVVAQRPGQQVLVVGDGDQRQARSEDVDQLGSVERTDRLVGRRRHGPIVVAPDRAGPLSHAVGWRDRRARRTCGRGCARRRPARRRRRARDTHRAAAAPPRPTRTNEPASREPASPNGHRTRTRRPPDDRTERSTCPRRRCTRSATAHADWA